jgi:hypothetical protein
MARGMFGAGLPLGALPPIGTGTNLSDIVQQAIQAAQGASQGGPALPAQAPSQAQQQPVMPGVQSQHISPWRVLDHVLGGSTISDALDSERSSRAAQEGLQSAAQLYANDPEAQVLLRTNPKAFLDAVAKNREQATVGGGDSRWIPGQGFMTAPKLVADGGIYGTQTADGYGQTGARGPTIAESETANNNAATQKLNLDRLLEDIRNNKVGNRVAEGNLGVAQQRLQFDKTKPTERGGKPKPWERSW